MPYQPPGSTTNGEMPPIADYSKIYPDENSIPELEKIFHTSIANITAIQNSWADLAKNLNTLIMGETAAYNPGLDPLGGSMPANPRDALAKLAGGDAGCFDSYLAQLQNWTGPAADEFIKKALQVRTFGVNIARCFYQLAEDHGGTWYGFTLHDTLGHMAADLKDAESVFQALVHGRQQIAQNIYDWLNNKVGSKGWGDDNDFPLNDGTVIRANFPSGSNYSNFTYQPLSPPHATYFIDGPYLLTGVCDYANYTVQFTRYEYHDFSFTYKEDRKSQWVGQNSVTKDDIMNFYAGDYVRQLRALISSFAASYVQGGESLPDIPAAPAGISDHTAGPAGPGYPQGSYNGGGSLPLGAGSPGGGYIPGGAPGGGVPGLGGVPGGASPGQRGLGAVPGGDFGSFPGSGNPGGNLPGGGNLGSGAGWNPTSLAGFNPPAGGGLGGTGLPGGGAGLPGGDLPGGGLPGGSGIGGAEGLGAGGALPGAGAGAGAAARGMPMPPMAGAGAGKEGKERQRAAWLSEDEDVWGAAGDGGDAVL